MSRKNIIFDDKKIDKTNFYKNEKLIEIDNVDVNNNTTLVFEKESYGKKSSVKYFIGYDDNDDIIKLPQMIGYAKYFDSTVKPAYTTTSIR